MKRNVAIGIIGVKLDEGFAAKRWERWRPSVALAMQEDLPLARFDLLYQQQSNEGLVRTIASDIAKASPGTEVRPIPLKFTNPWDFEDVYGALLDYARAQVFDTDNERYLVHITTGSHVAQICLFLLTEARFLPGQLVQTHPLREGSRSVGGTHSVVDLDLSRYDAIARRFRQLQREGASLLKGGIETRSARFNEMITGIERVAVASRAPILLLGPTGAGKTRLARRIYDLAKARRRISGPLVEVNCATIRGDGAMSALFGHRKGAFTGAIDSRSGLLVAANGGLLFLDEVGELGLDEQAMLLRALEEKRFLPVGSDKEVKSDFQLIAGTNRRLQACVREGTFREDLLARINLWTFELPPLVERREDIEPNLDHELDRFAEREGHRVTINREARQQFLHFAHSAEATWPANFRDLNAAVVRMATLAREGRITEDVVGEEVARLRRLWKEGNDESCATDFPALEALMTPEQLAAIDLFDRCQLEGVLRACAQCQSLSEAGRRLFDASRTRKTSVNDADRLRKYLARFGLSWEGVRAEKSAFFGPPRSADTER